MLVERLAGDSGLDYAVKVLGMHREHLVHVAQVDADAARGCVDLALERGAGAEGDDGHAVFRTDPHHVLDVGSFLRHHHAVRRLVHDPCGGMAVLLADGLRGDEAVCEPRGKLLPRGRKGFWGRPRGGFWGWGSPRRSSPRG